MSDLSNYSESKVYDWLTGRVTPPAVTTRYLALFTAVTDAEAGTGTEVTASGYARQAVTFGADTNGAGENSTELLFGPLSGAGTATHSALFDAAAGGNPLTAIKALPVSKTWADGDRIRFAPGTVDLSVA